MTKASAIQVQNRTQTKALYTNNLAVNRRQIQEHYIRDSKYYKGKEGVVYNPDTGLSTLIILPNQRHIPVIANAQETALDFTSNQTTASLNKPSNDAYFFDTSTGNQQDNHGGYTSFSLI